MELIVIGDTRMKIILTPEDMAHYCLDFNDQASDGDVTSGAIAELFSDVKQRCGFDIAANNILVQVWQSADGGCELYISKSQPDEDASKPHGRDRSVVRYIKNTYVFEELSPLLRVCHALLAKAYRRTSDAYAGLDGKWYLVLEAESGRDKPHDLSFVEEYAKKQSSSLANIILDEHARPIAKGDAVAILAPFA